MKKNLLFLLILGIVFASCNTSTKKQDEKADTPTEKVQANVSQVVHPDWSKDANIYEVNLRQFSREGTLQGFMKQMPRLKNMGVEILWIMPVHPIGKENRKGGLGSYYSVQDYTAVNPEFGNISEFKNMVKLAHELGMKLIIDWVANHTAWDHAWVTKHPEYYDLDSTGQMYAPFGWSDVVQLNFENKELWDVMIGEMEFWVREVDIDGFRCDVAGMVPTEFWNQARVELDEIKPVFMLAEANKPELLEEAFDMDYGWHFHHLSNLIAKGDTTADVVTRYFEELKTKIPAGAYKMNFTTNHDENSWNGTTAERYGEGRDAFAVLMATVPGMPLIYTGQEAANDKALEFFEHDPVDWKDYPLEGFYRNLLNLKKRNQALWNGNYGGEYVPVKNNIEEKVVTFTRTKNENTVFTIINLSGDELEIKLSGNGFTGEYTDAFSNKKVTFIENHQLKLKPWDYRIYIK